MTIQWWWYPVIKILNKSDISKNFSKIYYFSNFLAKKMPTYLEKYAPDLVSKYSPKIPLQQKTLENAGKKSCEHSGKTFCQNSGEKSAAFPKKRVTFGTIAVGNKISRKYSKSQGSSPVFSKKLTETNPEKTNWRFRIPNFCATGRPTIFWKIPLENKLYMSKIGKLEITIRFFRIFSVFPNILLFARLFKDFLEFSRIFYCTIFLLQFVVYKYNSQMRLIFWDNVL